MTALTEMLDAMAQRNALDLLEDDRLDALDADSDRLPRNHRYAVRAREQEHAARIACRPHGCGVTAHARHLHPHNDDAVSA